MPPEVAFFQSTLATKHMTLYGPNLTGAKRWYSCMERKYHPRRLVPMPFLGVRSQRSATSLIIAILSRHMGCTLTPEEILEDFRSVYYEIALSAYTTNLQAIDGFIPRENLLFRTDFPGM